MKYHKTLPFLAAISLLGACGQQPTPILSVDDAAQPVLVDGLVEQGRQVSKVDAIDRLSTFNESEVINITNQLEAWIEMNPNATYEDKNDAVKAIIANMPSSMKAQEDPLGIGPAQKALCLQNAHGVLNCTLTSRYKTMANNASEAAYPGNGYQGGKMDAFRHSYWNALMTRGAGVTWAQKFSDAHEADNPNEPYLSRQMDLWNNKRGQEAGLAFPPGTYTDAQVINELKYRMNVGTMRVYNEAGTSLVASNSVNACTTYDCINN